MNINSTLSREVMLEVPLFYTDSQGCPDQMADLYQAVLAGREETRAVPIRLDFLRSTKRDVMKMIDRFGATSSQMLFEWRWEQPMLDVLSHITRQKHRALFMKPGSQAIKRVQVLIGGGRQSLENLKIAWKIARHLKASITALRVMDPAWLGPPDSRKRLEYAYNYQSAMQNYLKRQGLPIPVQVVHEANAIDRLIHQARPSDLLVLGCPNNYVIRHGFAESHAGQALRHTAGPVLVISHPENETIGVTDRFWESTIICNLIAGSKWQAMEEMVEKLIDGGQLPFDKRKEVLADLFQRESEQSTYVGNGVAVPHAGVSECPELIGCLAISREGILYDPQEEPVNFIFLLITSDRDYSKYLKMQASIARFMKRGAMSHREELLRCNSAAEVAQVLQAELEPM